MSKVLLFGGVFLKPIEHELHFENTDVNKVIVPFESDRGLIGIEYSRKTGTDLFYSDYKMSKKERRGMEMQEWIEVQYANH